MDDLEGVYDERIAPLMTQIIAICKEAGMPVVASFQYKDEHLCTTIIVPEHADDKLKKAAATLRPGLGPAFRIRTLSADGAVQSEEIVLG